MGLLTFGLIWAHIALCFVWLGKRYLVAFFATKIFGFEDCHANSLRKVRN